MRLRVIGTGSSGNAYVLVDENDNVLILDAGMKASQIFADIYDEETVCGCLVTHEHADHSRAVFDLAYRGVRVGMSQGTMDYIGADKVVNCEALQELKTYRYGPYKVKPFKVQHDAAEPFGFLIENVTTGELLVYATDTYYLHHTFPNLNYWIVECNYVDMDSLAGAQEYLRRRLITSHMSLERLKQALAANDLSKTTKIVLVHLSDSRGDEERMVSEVEAMTGVQTTAAMAGMIISLETEPF